MQELGGSALGPPYKAKAVANFFLGCARAEDVPLSPMKLQKLIYFAHGWYLALVGRPLIDERIQAWQYGPVVRTVYDEFRKFGNDPISGRAESLEYKGDGKMEFVHPEIPHADQQSRTLLTQVWKAYKHLTAYQLSTLTHQSGTPWDQTYSENQGIRNLTIDDGLIKKAFEQMANDNRQRNAPAAG